MATEAADEETSHFGKMFALLDTYGTGRIQLAAVQQFNATLPGGLRVEEERLTDMFKEYDVDCSGDIDVDEFHGLCQKIGSITKLSTEAMAEHFRRRQLQRLFDMVDESGFKDRSISQYELQTFLEALKDAPEVKYSAFGVRIKQVDVARLIAQEIAQSSAGASEAPGEGKAEVQPPAESQGVGGWDDDDDEVVESESVVISAADGLKPEPSMAKQLAPPQQQATPTLSLDFDQFCRVIDKIIIGCSITFILHIFSEAAHRRKQRKSRALTAFVSKEKVQRPEPVSLDELKKARGRSPAASVRLTPAHAAEVRHAATSSTGSGAATRERIIALEAEVEQWRKRCAEADGTMSAMRDEHEAVAGELAATDAELRLLRAVHKEQEAENRHLRDVMDSADGAVQTLNASLEEARQQLREVEGGRNLLKAKLGAQQRRADALDSVTVELRERIAALTSENAALRAEVQELREEREEREMAMANVGVFGRQAAAMNERRNATGSVANVDTAAAGEAANFEEFAFSSGVTFSIPVVDDDWWRQMAAEPRLPSSGSTTTGGMQGTPGVRAVNGEEGDAGSEAAEGRRLADTVNNFEAAIRCRAASLTAATSADFAPSTCGSATDNSEGSLAAAGCVHAHISDSLLPAIERDATAIDSAAQSVQGMLSRLALSCEMMLAHHRDALETLRAVAALPTLTTLVDEKNNEADHDDGRLEDGGGGSDDAKVVLTQEAALQRDSLVDYLTTLHSKRESLSARAGLCEQALVGTLIPAHQRATGAASSVLGALALLDSMGGCSGDHDDGPVSNVELGALITATDLSIVRLVRVAAFLLSTVSATSALLDVSNVCAELGIEDATVCTEALRAAGVHGTCGALLVEALALLVVTAMHARHPCGSLPGCVGHFLEQPRRSRKGTPGEERLIPSALDEAQRQLDAFATALDSVSARAADEHLHGDVTTSLKELRSQLGSHVTHRLERLVQQQQAPKAEPEATRHDAATSPPTPHAVDIEPPTHVQLQSSSTQSPLRLVTTTGTQSICSSVDPPPVAVVSSPSSLLAQPDADATVLRGVGEDAEEKQLAWRPPAKKDVSVSTELLGADLTGDCAPGAGNVVAITADEGVKASPRVFITAEERALVAARLRECNANRDEDVRAASALAAQLLGHASSKKGEEEEGGETGQLEALLFPDRETPVQPSNVSLSDDALETMQFVRSQAALRLRLDQVANEFAKVEAALSSARAREEELLALNTAYAKQLQQSVARVTSLEAAQAAHTEQIETMAHKAALLERYIARLEQKNLNLAMAIPASPQSQLR